MASLWGRPTGSRSNIHEFQDPEIREYPKIALNTTGRFFTWQRLGESAQVGGRPTKEYFRVEETRSLLDIPVEHEHEVEAFKPLTSTQPLRTYINSMGEDTPTQRPDTPFQRSETNLATGETGNSGNTAFEDMRRRRQKWVYKYNI